MDRAVQAQAYRDRLNLLRRRVFPHHGGDRTAGHRINHGPDAGGGNQQHWQELQQAPQNVRNHGLPPGESTTSWRSSSTLARVRPKVSSDRMVKVRTSPGNTA